MKTLNTYSYFGFDRLGPNLTFEIALNLPFSDLRTSYVINKVFAAIVLIKNFGSNV